ncbi:methyltransferase [Gluconobacter oxydans]|uniref:class I SAM-dependent methyltransferase n=1 Tax=Gluconobacter thailandicus TaxID=257438 RepID=UPI0002998C26|nr:methyltransferase domain-containing protein [Gluconobacter thailandicus]AFW02349.1 methyltransferase type 12 [Gluconobacter oxydans H24]ANQ42137.1 methyltransferase [Gluconobacter oxydans]
MLSKSAFLCMFSLLSVAPAFADPTLDQAVQSPGRSTAFVSRDVVRHPVEELTFFGLKPDANVVEIWPFGGYWTQILAPYLHDYGTYTVALGPFDLKKQTISQFQSEHPEVYGRIKTTQFASQHLDFAPANSVDLVLTFRNMHNWMKAGNAPEMLAAIHRALKPGGILGIEDHRGNTTAPQDPQAKDGYVRQAYAIDLIQKAGFKLVGTSEINANPKDTANWPKGVWTLPPTYALGAKDHAKYEAIGEGDNFVLKFQKIKD